MEIKVTNVNQALSEGLWWLKVHGVKEDSRNGPVLVSPEPVMTIYERPTERVLFSPLRDANPFFHLFEALWMLAGRNDVEWPAQFAKQILQYSDDGKTMRGAYGYRWRNWFGYDQLHILINELKHDPNTRRAVLTMWDATEHDSSTGGDLLATSLDKPCNTHVYFDARGGKLNMTVLCRSNDIWWGAYGANAVHFSVLQEYIAFAVGVPVGLYRQFSNNYHLYTNVVSEERLTKFAADAKDGDCYKGWYADVVEPYPLIQTSIEAWEEDLKRFMLKPYEAHQYHDPFFNFVARPMFVAWWNRKAGFPSTARVALGEIVATDWQRACSEWIERREAKKNARTA